MTSPLTAGEPLARPPRGGRRDRPRKPTPDKTKSNPKAGRRLRPFRLVGRLFGVLFGLLFLAGAAGAVVAVGAYEKFGADLPDVDSLKTYQPPVMSRVYAGDSRLLSELATERRIFVPIGAIPPLVQHAFISAEDQNFYSNPGVDPVAIVRAGLTDLAQIGQGRRPIGASTITQQVAKNMLLGNEVSLSRKIKELILAWRLDGALSKNRILELYLNEIYLGLQSYGVAAAAQAYFNKPLDQLTVAEAAFLAALPKAPSNLNPFRYPDAARARRDYVVDRMAADHVITTAEAVAAKAGPVATAEFHRPDMVAGADYFAEEVRRRLVARFGADKTTQGGLSVRTSLDPALQATAETALRDGLLAYDRARGGWRGPVSHLAMTPALRNGWATTLAQTPRPPGMLGKWRLGMVLETTDSEAHIGILERLDPSGPLQPRELPLALSSLAWARPALRDSLGPAPRRITDVLQAGDLVMVEPEPAVAAAGKTPARPERLALRQIPLVQGAIVSMDPVTGRVLAMSGGWSFEQSQFNRATQATRQPGSSFKPMVYLAAMEKNISPSQRVLDVPYVVDLGAAGKWRPHNDENDFSGPVSLHMAIAKSLNLVTVRLASQIGMDAVAQTAIAFHVVDTMPHVLPAALGAVGTTVLRQAAAYASLDMGGREVRPSFIDSVQDSTGKILWQAPGLSCAACDPAATGAAPAAPAMPPALIDDRTQLADPASVFQVVTMLQGVMLQGTGVPVGAGINHVLAGKTGTSNDFTDAWFVGFTPDLVTAVWVGFDDPTKSLGNNAFGAQIAGPIWHDYMAAALKDRPMLKFIPPPDVTLATWDSGSGPVTDAFKAGQVPGASGPMGGSADADTTDPSPVSGTAVHAAGVDSGLGGLY
jgi:penicillin-binding protein 1A